MPILLSCVIGKFSTAFIEGCNLNSEFVIRARTPRLLNYGSAFTVLGFFQFRVFIVMQSIQEQCALNSARLSTGLCNKKQKM